MISRGMATINSIWARTAVRRTVLQAIIPLSVGDKAEASHMGTASQRTVASQVPRSHSKNMAMPKNLDPQNATLAHLLMASVVLLVTDATYKCGVEPRG
jgi:hypothetical protein